jgi:hypothetical protein
MPFKDVITDRRSRNTTPKEGWNASFNSNRKGPDSLAREVENIM